VVGHDRRHQRAARPRAPVQVAPLADEQREGTFLRHHSVSFSEPRDYLYLVCQDLKSLRDRVAARPSQLIWVDLTGVMRHSINRSTRKTERINA